MTTATQPTTLSDICTTETLAKEHPSLFNQGQLTWLVKNRNKNGLADAGAVLKISQKIWFYPDITVTQLRVV